jgi:hypothetical protein
MQRVRERELKYAGKSKIITKKFLMEVFGGAMKKALSVPNTEVMFNDNGYFKKHKML